MPTPAQRQDTRLPERQSRGATKDSIMSRRRGYAALMKGASGGDLTPVSKTAAPFAQKLGA